MINIQTLQEFNDLRTKILDAAKHKFPKATNVRINAISSQYIALQVERSGEWLDDYITLQDVNIFLTDASPLPSVFDCGIGEIILLEDIDDEGEWELYQVKVKHPYGISLQNVLTGYAHFIEKNGQVHNYKTLKGNIFVNVERIITGDFDYMIEILKNIEEKFGIDLGIPR